MALAAAGAVAYPAAMQLIAGNWKMNGLPGPARALAAAIAQGAAGVRAELLVCPPFTALASVGAALEGSAVGLGAQDCHPAPCGAYTGDVAAPMLAAVGCRAVIVGHSERRAGHGETDTLVAGKARAAADAGLMPIVCVGEFEADRDAGGAERLVCDQLAASLPDGFAGAVAYEPIWAIGTGRTPSVEDVAVMHGALRATLMRRLGPAGAAVRILYGGSVKPENAAMLLALPEVGGALVGGASLEAAAFLAIAGAAAAS